MLERYIDNIDSTVASTSTTATTTSSSTTVAATNGQLRSEATSSRWSMAQRARTVAGRLASTPCKYFRIISGYIWLLVPSSSSIVSVTQVG